MDNFLAFQFQKGDSPLHRWDPRLKLIIVILINLLVYRSNLHVFMAYLGLIALCMVSVRFPLLAFLGKLRFLLLVFLIAVIWNFFSSSLFPSSQIWIGDITITIYPLAGLSILIRFTKLMVMLLINHLLLWSSAIIGLRDSVYFFIRPFSVKLAQVISTMIRTTFVAIPALWNHSKEIEMKLKARGGYVKRRFFYRLWATGKLLLEKTITYSSEYSLAIRARGYDYSLNRLSIKSKSGKVSGDRWKSQYQSYFVAGKTLAFQLFVSVFLATLLLFLYFFIPTSNLAI